MPKSDRFVLGSCQRDRSPRELIACEGAKTEPGYLEQLKQAERLPIRPIVVPTGTPRTVVEKAVELKSCALASRDASDYFEEVWRVFDIDLHPKVPDATQQAKAHGISPAVSNPCFELFVLLHFQDQTAPIHRHQAQSLCRKSMPGYQKRTGREGAAPNVQEHAAGRAPKRVRCARVPQKRGPRAAPPAIEEHGMIQGGDGLRFARVPQKRKGRAGAAPGGEEHAEGWAPKRVRFARVPQKSLLFEKLAPLTEDARARATELDKRHGRNGAPGENPSTGVHHLVRQIRTLR